MFYFATVILCTNKPFPYTKGRKPDSYTLYQCPNHPQVTKSLCYIFPCSTDYLNAQYKEEKNSVSYTAVYTVTWQVDSFLRKQKLSIHGNILRQI